LNVVVASATSSSLARQKSSLFLAMAASYESLTIAMSTFSITMTITNMNATQIQKENVSGNRSGS